MRAPWIVLSLLLAGCSTVDGEEPTPLATDSTQALLGRNVFRFETGDGGGWAAAYLDLPPGFLANASKVRFDFRTIPAESAADPKPHWIVLVWDVQGDFTKSLFKDNARRWSLYAPISEMARGSPEVSRLNASATSVAALLVTDVKMRGVLEYQFGEGGPEIVRRPLQGDLTFRGPADSPDSLPAGFTGTSASFRFDGGNGTGAEMLVIGARLAANAGTWSYDAEFRFSNGETILREGASGFAPPSGPEEKLVPGQAEFAFCTPPGPSSLELRNVRLVGTELRPFDARLGPEVLRALSIEC